MKDEEKTKDELVAELNSLRKKVTELKLLNDDSQIAVNQSIEWYKSIFRNSLDLVYMHDFEGNFLNANPAALELLGYKKEEITDINFVSLLSDDQLGNAAAALKEIMDTGAQKKATAFRVLTGKNEYKIVETKAFIIKVDGRNFAILGIARDITEREIMEEELRKHREELEDLVQDRTRELQKITVQQQWLIEKRAVAEAEKTLALEKAKDANTTKGRFLANVSHELKTPLNSILGYCRLLEMQKIGALNRKQQDFVATMKKDGNHLLRIVNEIIDISKIDAGKIEIKKSLFEIHDMVMDVYSIVKPLAMKKGITVDVEINEDIGQLYADEARIKQVLNNLMANALKYIGDGKQFGIEAAGRENAVIFRVWDEGIGIPPENRDKIFERFEQVNVELSVKNKGTGLGLAISRAIVTLHNGTIEVTNGYERGSCFTVVLPRKTGDE
ncbi:MAG: PAS domain S-box protein [bacterium]|nr:PAS domain S-box protein [bacterium]